MRSQTLIHNHSRFSTSTSGSRKMRLPLNWTEPHLCQKTWIKDDPGQSYSRTISGRFNSLWAFIQRSKWWMIICFNNIIIPYLTLVLHNLLLSHVKIWIFKMIFCLSHQQGLQRQRRPQPLLLPRQSLSSLCPCGNTQISAGTETWSQTLCLL